MDVDSVLASAPRAIRVKAERGEASYELAEDLIAVHGAGPSPGADLVFEGGEIAVEPLAEHGPAQRRSGVLGPVYRRKPGGAVAVPTGRVFVSFCARERAEGHRAELEASGYRLEEVPAYAPQAAWVRHRSEDIAAALRDLDRLERIPGVEGVEPQILSEAASRT
jgi:hypothetical protein